MKSTFQIFSDLKDDWDKMSNSEKQALAISYAGRLDFACDRLNCGKEGVTNPIYGYIAMVA